MKHALNLVCTSTEMPFTGMGQYLICNGSGYTSNSATNSICSCYIKIGSSQEPQLYLSDTASASVPNTYYTTLVNGDKVDIYF